MRGGGRKEWIAQKLLTVENQKQVRKMFGAGVRLQNEQKAEITDKETNEKDACRRGLLFPLPPGSLKLGGCNNKSHNNDVRGWGD